MTLEFGEWPLWANALLIFFSRVTDVTLGTLRIAFISRGEKSLAPLIAFFEMLIWLLAKAGTIDIHADVAELGCLEPTVEPRATGHIDDMKAMIERLVEKDCAYVAEDHVLFHVAAMPDYGVLANRSLDEMLAGVAAPASIWIRTIAATFFFAMWVSPAVNGNACDRRRRHVVLRFTERW